MIFRYKIVKEGRNIYFIKENKGYTCKKCGKKIEGTAWFLNFKENKSYCSDCAKKIKDKINETIKINDDDVIAFTWFVLVDKEDYNEIEGKEIIYEIDEFNNAKIINEV